VRSRINARRMVALNHRLQGGALTDTGLDGGVIALEMAPYNVCVIFVLSTRRLAN